MIPVPRLQQSICGLSLKTGTFVILYTTLITLFVGLVAVTAFRLEHEESIDAAELDMQYILNMVVAILVFLVTPLALYGVHHERAAFMVPFIGMHIFGIILLLLNFMIEFTQSLETEGLQNTKHVVFLSILTGIVSYTFLIIYSQYLVFKEQREEIK